VYVSNSKSQFNFLSKLKVPSGASGSPMSALESNSPDQEGNPQQSSGRPRNKAVDPGFVKLTAYVPRSLHAALKMAMAMDTTSDQSQYVEHALKDWLAQHHPATLEHTGYKGIGVEL
jgi:hypothetical protein